MARTTASHDRTAADRRCPSRRPACPARAGVWGGAPRCLTWFCRCSVAYPRHEPEHRSAAPGGWSLPSSKCGTPGGNAHQVATLAAEDSALGAFVALDWVLRPAVRAASGKGALSSAELGARAGQVVGSAVGGCGAAGADGAGLAAAGDAAGSEASGPVLRRLARTVMATGGAGGAADRDSGQRRVRTNRTGFRGLLPAGKPVASAVAGGQAQPEGAGVGRAAALVGEHPHSGRPPEASCIAKALIMLLQQAGIEPTT